MAIQESVLARLIQCPLMTPTSPSNVETCAYALASWALRKSFSGKFSGQAPELLHEMRGKALDLWAGDVHKAGAIVRVLAYRTLQLVLDYEIVHLEQPYNLILTGYTIQGQYALLRKRKGAGLPYVLILYLDEPELRHHQIQPPSVATLARFVHIRTTTDYSNACILHYPMLKGKNWMTKTMNISLAKKYLNDMLRLASLGLSFPVAGKHCNDCLDKSCLKVFYE